MSYFVYVDLTSNLIPFYVGYGKSQRLKNKSRNQKHDNIARKYGQIRVIAFQTDVKTLAHEMEIQIMDDCQTLITKYPNNHFACNFKSGGAGGGEGFRSRGFSGKHHTRSTIAKIKMTTTGRRQAPEHSSKIAASLTGQPKSETHRKALSHAKMSPQTQRVINEIDIIMERINKGETRLSICKEYGASSSSFYAIVASFTLQNQS